MDTWYDVAQVVKSVGKVKKKGILWKNTSHLLLGNHGREREKKKRSPRLLSTIYGVPSVIIRRAKSLSSFTRRGLRVCTKNAGFHRRSKRGDFKKSKFPGLGGVLETSYHSTMLQEVGVLPTLVYYQP